MWRCGGVAVWRMRPKANFDRRQDVLDELKHCQLE